MEAVGGANGDGSEMTLDLQGNIEDVTRFRETQFQTKELHESTDGEEVKDDENGEQERSTHFWRENEHPIGDMLETRELIVNSSRNGFDFVLHFVPFLIIYTF
jgi:hypothetical protein